MSLRCSGANTLTVVRQADEYVASVRHDSCGGTGVLSDKVNYSVTQSFDNHGRAEIPPQCTLSAISVHVCRHTSTIILRVSFLQGSKTTHLILKSVRIFHKAFHLAITLDLLI